MRLWPLGGNFFPGTNLQDLNLDWILEKVRECLDLVEDVDSRIEGAYEAAEQAAIDAATAQSAATTAGTSATAAQASAQAAAETASAAQTAAQTATQTASAAQTAAQAAQTTADGAVDDLSSVHTYLTAHIPEDPVDDLNTRTPYGIIRLLRWTTTTLNTPNTEGLVGSSLGGLCLSFCATSSTGVQLALANSTLKIFMRGYTATRWSDWTQIAPSVTSNSASAGVSLDTAKIEEEIASDLFQTTTD